MIITRTPFRISFFGGGTDYPQYYQEHGGAVLSTTINKYCYVTCRYYPPFFTHRYHIRYSEKEVTQTIDEIKHPSVRECLRFSGIQEGVEITHAADIPARSGIGSSSSFTVGLLNALYALQGKMVTRRKLAMDAMHVEQDLVGEHVGSQDQTAAAFGGFNKIEFDAHRGLWVTPVTLNEAKLQRLQEHFLFYFTGLSRTASEIAAEQIRTLPQRLREMDTMKQMVDEALNILMGSPDSYADFGRLLHESWLLKRGLSSHITNPEMDAIYDAALRAGALGGKLCGAGGGGFMLLFVPPEQQPAVKAALGNLLLVPFRIETLGSHVILYAT